MDEMNRHGLRFKLLQDNLKLSALDGIHDLVVAQAHEADAPKRGIHGSLRRGRQPWKNGNVDVGAGCWKT